MPGYTCVCVIYLAGSAGDAWTALTDPQRSAVYWTHHNVSDWRPGSAWEHQRTDGSGIADIAGTVIESSAPERLVLTWAHPGDGTPVAGAGTDAGPAADGQRLTVTHGDLASEAERDALAAGWAAVLSNLKSFLETGRALPTRPGTCCPDSSAAEPKPISRSARGWAYGGTFGSDGTYGAESTLRRVRRGSENVQRGEPACSG